MLIVIGVALIIVGVFSGFFGKLPGDISFKKGNFSFHFPIVTSIMVSVILSVILFIISKFR